MAQKRNRKKATSTQPKTPRFTFSKQNKIILGSLGMLLSVALCIAFISFFFTWQQDQSLLSEFSDRNALAENWLNKFGASVSYFFIYKGFGLAAFIFIYLFFLTGLHWFIGLDKKKLANRWVWGILAIIWFSILFGFFAAKAPLLGGIVGYEMNDFLQDYIGKIGIILLLLFGFIVFAVKKLQVTPEKVGSQVAGIRESMKRDFHKAQREAVANKTEKDEKEEEPLIHPTGSDTPSPFEIALENREKQTKTSDFSRIDKTSDVDIENSFEIKIAEGEDDEDIPEPTLKTAPAEHKTDDDIRIEVEKIEEEKEATEILSDKLVKDFGEFDPKLELGKYQYPPLDLLNDHGGQSGITINQEELEENKNRIVETLKHYKIDISQIKATIGPTVTLYEIVPQAGVRISKIKNLEDDIALSLAALGIRIIAPIPGKGTIGIEVPNKNPTTVSMRSVIASTRFQNAEMELPIALGKNISNETFVVDLAKMPHLLMAGATGQGKSVGLNAILTSLLYKKHPAEVKFVLVDPKKVELTLFNKIERHYLAKLPDTEEAIITDNTKVINTLNSLCIEMDNRYELLKDAMVRNIKEYNTKFRARKLNPANGHKFLPYIVLVVDEFADLIMTAGKEVETPIARLAQLARAIGIHLIIATQRPSVNVITGIIKANFPARIAFRVTSKIDSRTILDSQGADQLIGRGDMLYTQGNDLVRLQCAFVDTPEVSKITDFIGSQKAYPDAHLLPEYVGEESGTSLDVNPEERDALFKEAAEVIVIAQQGSASLLQRKLKLGYNRAGRIIDQLEAAGIVGPFEGSKARQVLIPDTYALEQFFNNEQENSRS
ncbi:DNA segregation ATPase FtsK/SpoIIIE, S-DNA-T family [Sinomicrobium oceani]|uniref:DNA segregation ATPase FtsK/SpoIIIE, S-DNA-T family n=1 Tax=Sinomicrobium oceani TaxID=1150368 RepID=A0A1K1Q8U5_9FLAO|nr:DNA translocase FtsK [Sinomicrobium oceani]SFW56351.1 DNA segregation ATPase FtsK/SpoIIIE, S-DNA-T family [Sinomicrobium oceani]